MGTSTPCLFVLPLAKIIEASKLTATFGSKRDHQGAILRTRRIVAAIFTAGALLFATATGASAGTSGTVYSAGSYAKATFAPNNPGYHSAYIKVIDNRKDGASAVAQVKFDGTTKNYRASDGVGSSVTWFPGGIGRGESVSVRACRQDVSAGGPIKDCGAWKTFIG